MSQVMPIIAAAVRATALIEVQDQGPIRPDSRLDALADIVVPDAVAFTPLTLGWKLVAGVLVLVLLAAGWAAVRRYRQNLYRRDALAELQTLQGAVAEAGVGRGRAIRAVPVLLRRVALSAARRESVASLTGSQWLDYLDTRYPGNGFAQGPGCEVEAVGYLPDSALEQLSPAAVDGILTEVRSWIESHEVDRA